MAAPLVQRVTLDSAAAQRELAQLERQLLTLNQPINVPVDIDVDGTRRAETQMEGLRKEVDQTGDEFTQLGRKADQSTDAVLRVGSRGTSAFTSLKGSILGVGAALAAIQGARLAGVFAADAIQKASSFNEALSKTKVVFGQLSGEIEKFAARGPEALGLSTSAALQATSTFGNLFIALGLTQEAAAELSPGIVQLAADLASFNDIAVDEAVEKLRSGLVGEVEPLRSLGVNLNAATVDAKALELGFIDAAGAVTDAGKVQARYALILEQTSTAQGDYARTADGIANTQRSLSAAFEDAQRKIGEALLPAYKAILDVVPTIIASIEDLTPVVAAMSQSFADAVPAVSGFADAIQVLTAVGAVAGILKEGSDATRDFALGMLQIRFGGFKQGFNQIAEGIDSINTAMNSIQTEPLEQELVNALQAGVEPAKALANELIALSQTTLNPQEIRDEARALAAISGLDFSTLADLGEFLRQAGAAQDLSPAQISAITVGIVTLDKQITTSAQNELSLIKQIDAAREKGAPKARQAKAEQIAASREAAAAAAEETEILARLQAVSETTGQSLFFIAQNSGLFGQEVAGLVTQFGAAELEALGLAEGFAAIAGSLKFDTTDAVDELDLLISKTNEAGEEVPLSVREMNEALRTEANNLATIEAGTIILEALGFDALAKDIRTKSIPDALAAVKLYTSDFKEAASAELTFDEGGNIGEQMTRLVEESIRNGNLTPELLEYLSGLTSESVLQTVLAAAGIGAEAYVNDWQERLKLSHVNLPPGFFVGNFNLTGGVTVNPGTPSSSAPGAVVTNNFYDTPNPTTDTTRIANSVSTIAKFRS